MYFELIFHFCSSQQTKQTLLLAFTELNKQATEAPELWTEKEGSTSVEKESTANESLEATTAITEKTNSSTEDNVKKPTTV